MRLTPKSVYFLMISTLDILCEVTHIWYCTNMVDFKALNIHEVSQIMWISSESTQNVDHFGVSPITSLLKRYVQEFYPHQQWYVTNTVHT